MKFNKNIFLLIAVLFFNCGFSQTKSKKETKKIIIKAADAFFNLDAEKSLKLSKEALDNAHALKDNALMAEAYNIIALNFEEYYDFKKGINYYNKALYYANLAHNDTVKSHVYNNLGNYYSIRNVDVKKSIEYYKKSLFFAKKINDSTDVMYLKLNICATYFDNNDFTNGVFFLNDAKETIDKSDELDAKLTMCDLYGSYYTFTNENKKAEYYFNQAINLRKQSDSQVYNSNMVDVYNDFSNYYKKNNNFEKALYYLNLHKELVEKNNAIEKAKKAKLFAKEIELDEFKRYVDKIEDEKDKQSENLKQSKLVVLLFVIILFIALLLLFSLYKNNKFREKTNEQLKLTNEELKEAKEQAEEASRLKTQFVSTISHELRTPLYGVVGITNIILDEHKELSNSPHLNSLKFSARYLLSLVNDLLQINKIEENKIVLENLIFNLTDELRSIIDSLEFIAIKNNNKLICDIAPNIPEFLIGDKLRLSQIFMNLISNALKFTKDGEVKVTAKLDRVEGIKYFIHFSIKDNGVGIAKEDQEKIFEKFVQIERKESDYQGTGLGLSIVQKLTELFGSKIYLESEEGIGTTFSFTIGLEADESKKNEIINNIEVDLSANYFYKILVVEDNKINQIVTKKILESNNFRCTMLEDGYAAINILDEEHFDIILMDINMPIINGFETTKLIRKKGIITPIIALTAFDKQEITEQALSCGMDDIIIKPFEQSKFFQVINNIINKKNVDY